LNLILKKTLDDVLSKNCVIQVFGLGYVGFPLLVKLCTNGFHVLGIDNDSKKIERIQNGELLESESHLKEIVLKSIHSGDLVVDTQSAKSEKPRIGIICVPTPIPTKSIQSDIFVKDAVKAFLEMAKKGDVIILESSIEVGTTSKMKSMIESMGYKEGEDIGLCFCPERIDPQNKKWNLENIPRVIYCSDDLSFKIAKEIYQYINNSNLLRVKSAEIAEVVKSFENAFRLVNISLVNELAILCDKLGINVRDVLDAAATKPFGFLTFYPGAGAGGHCIPKDPRFLLESAKKLGLEFKTLENALSINIQMPKYVVDSIESLLIEKKLKKSVIICGLSYKPDIEDMRDSPGFKIYNELTERGFQVALYDPFFKNELSQKYVIENNIKDPDFKILPNLSDDSISSYDCLCIVQHHSKLKDRLNEIYKNSKIPIIYDCQGNLRSDPSSNSTLKILGG